MSECIETTFMFATFVAFTNDMRLSFANQGGMPTWYFEAREGQQINRDLFGGEMDSSLFPLRHQRAFDNMLGHCEGISFQKNFAFYSWQCKIMITSIHCIQECIQEENANQLPWSCQSSRQPDALHISYFIRLPAFEALYSVSFIKNQFLLEADAQHD